MTAMTEWSASAVLAISHGAVESNLGRKRYAAFADWPEFRLHLLAPRQWHEYGRCLQADPAEAPGITLHIEDIRLARLPLIKWYGHHYPRLGAIVKEVQPDVIHLWEEPWSVVALQATALCGSAALVLEVDQNILKRLLPPFESIRRRVLRRADLILARSQDAEDVVRACGFAGPVRRIGYGVDQNIFKPGVRQRADKSGLRLAYVGRLDEAKGLEDIVRGMAASKSISQLTIVGEGPYKSQLMQLVRQHGLTRRVTVIPWSDTRAVADAFRRADVSLIVSRTTVSWREQFGRTIIESQACGVPVIGSSSGSIPEVVGAGGWIVPERDPKALCQLFDRLADVPEEIEDRGQAALKNVASRFTFDITARVLRDAWLEARQERTRLGEEMRPQCVSDPKSDLADPEARNPGARGAPH
jgi:glycosyltransferase involved in cell wall biosynthesis